MRGISSQDAHSQGSFNKQSTKNYEHKRLEMIIIVAAMLKSFHEPGVIWGSCTGISFDCSCLFLLLETSFTRLIPCLRAWISKSREAETLSSITFLLLPQLGRGRHIEITAVSLK